MVGADEQRAAALGTAQPLLPGAGVEVAAELAHIDRHRPERLCGVEQERHPCGDQGGDVGDLAADPRDVRAGDQTGGARDFAGELGERDDPDLYPVAPAGPPERREQAGMLRSEVTISSPARRSRPPITVLTPSVVEPVSATSDASQPSTLA